MASSSSSSRHDEQELLNALARDPEALDGYLVLADLLSSRGDPRGELIVLEHKVLTKSATSTQARRTKNLLEELANKLPGAHVFIRVADWHLGFLRRVDFSCVEGHGSPLSALSDLLKDESAVLLRELLVETGFLNGLSTIEALSERHYPALEQLSIMEPVGDNEPPCKHRQPVSHLWSCVPNLKRLRLRAERSLFHTIAHPTLERLDLEVYPLCEKGTWDLPSLRTLTWDPHIESECDIGVFDVLWNQKLPALRELILRGYMVTFKPTLKRPKVRAMLKQLERLTLPPCAIVHGGATTTLADELIENASALEHLRSLTIEDVDESSEDIGDLAAAQKRLPSLVLKE